ncbi:MAG: diaminopimelate decarboxylase [Lachnospiraceae bacterium]|nr:diaminopimelate decarboxylase [Lachnospiraceae bacterium]
MDDLTFKTIREKYGTPVFVFDTKALCMRADAIRSMLSEFGCKFVYSIKANPFLIGPLVDHVDAFEVCSPGELMICRHGEVPADKIIYSGVNKGAADVKEAVCYASDDKGQFIPAGILTAESYRHYTLIKDAADTYATPVKVILRLSSKNQFGMSEKDIVKIISENSEDDLVSIAGIHYFAGTQRTKLSHQCDELKMLKDFITRLRESTGAALPFLEYGPGLPHPYFEGDDFSDTLAPLRELTDDLKDISSICSLSVEMGRFLASPCGYYLTEVADTKESFDHKWCILDGGINHVNYLGSMMGLKCPVIRVINDNTGAEEHYTLCGSLCTTNDVLVRDFTCAPLAIGDLLAFENIGAYSITEGMYLFLSRTMPKVILYDGSEAQLVRDAIETWYMARSLNKGELNRGE